MKQISFDATKLKKEKMRDGKWVELTPVEFKEKKVKTKKDGSPIQGDGWRLMKLGFVKQKGDKGEEMPIIGDITEFEKTGSPDIADVPEYPEDNIDVDSVPF